MRGLPAVALGQLRRQGLLVEADAAVCPVGEDRVLAEVAQREAADKLSGLGAVVGGFLTARGAHPATVFRTGDLSAESGFLAPPNPRRFPRASHV